MCLNEDEFWKYSAAHDLSDFCMKEMNNAKLSRQWEQIIKSNNYCSLKSRELLTDIVFKGVPNDVRSAVWNKFALMDLSPNFYYSNINLEEISNTTEYIIRRDALKALRENCENALGDSERDILIRILKSYAAIDKEVGYTQGISFLLYRLFALTGNEEKCFWTFFGLMQNPETSIRNIFYENTHGVSTFTKEIIYFIQQKVHWTEKKYLKIRNSKTKTSYVKYFQIFLMQNDVSIETKNIILDRLIIFGEIAAISFEILVLKSFSWEILFSRFNSTDDTSRSSLFSLKEIDLINDTPLFAQMWNNEWISVDEYHISKKIASTIVVDF